MQEGPISSQDLQGKTCRLAVQVVGCGASALALAAHLNPEKFRVAIFERNAAPARKFLVAGSGGLNITHSESPDSFIKRYTPDQFLDKAFGFFNNHDCVKWLQSMGIETYVGSSGRIFPVKSLKPVQVLNKIILHLESRGVEIFYGHSWEGWDENGLMFNTKNGQLKMKAPVTVFALGGASWPVTGSDGSWTEQFRSKGIALSPFQSSNCTMHISWPPELSIFFGAPLKNIAVQCSGRWVRGEVVITSRGLEGSGIYPLSPQIRAQLNSAGKALVCIDMKPQLTREKIVAQLKKPGTITERLRTLRLSAAQIGLLRYFSSKEEFNDGYVLAGKIKGLELVIEALSPVEEAISTVGGLRLDEISPEFELIKQPGHYAIGEMLDYDAPTGGYLLQSCFSMGAYLAHILNSSV